MSTLNQIKQVVQAESNHMIKELKASSSSAALRLYAEAAHSIIITPLVLKAQVLAYTFCEITIKSSSEISEQCLQTKQDIIYDVFKVINFLSVVLVACCLLSRDVTLFFNSEQSHSI